MKIVWLRQSTFRYLDFFYDGRKSEKHDAFRPVVGRPGKGDAAGVLEVQRTYRVEAADANRVEVEMSFGKLLCPFDTAQLESNLKVWKSL